MPLEAKVWLSTHFQLGWRPKYADRVEAGKEVARISLLTQRQLAQLFPEASLYTERFAGMPKSFVAYYGWR